MAKKTTEHSWCCCGSKLWGWCFLIVGLYLLSTHLGWIPRNIPFWPIVLIVIGICLLKKYNK